MIQRLVGNIVYKDPKYVVLDVNGVGYKVFTTAESVSDDIEINTDKVVNITLWTYMAVRENAIDLYGFISQRELAFFELLLTISGIGPKTALGILNSASVETIETAVQTEDISHLTKVSGIGKKVADKIVMELKDKIDKITHTPESKVALKNAMRNDSDALEALKALGYSQNESRDVLKELPKTITKTSDRIKEALKILGR